MILKSVTRLLVFFINILAIYLMIGGHNNPGGGFIAGLITAISLVLMVISLGIDEVKRIIRVDPVLIGIFGLVLAYGLPSLVTFFDRPFFKHGFYHGPIPLIGEIHVGTPLVFDLGVYLVVVGITAKIIMTFCYLIYEKQEYFLEETFLYSAKRDTALQREKESG